MWPSSEGIIAVRECGCDFCQKHGGVYTSHPKAVLNVRLTHPEIVTKYRFGTNTADFLICGLCGVVPAVTSEIEGKLYAVVNVNTFENVKSDEMAVSPADFEGENESDRLARRQRNWIGRVTIAQTP
ncbi:MAG: hypothetical protein AAF530_19030 [Pseudomonadota bacterium]